MATMPQDPMAMQGAAPGAEQAPAAAMAVTITKQPDGTFTVAPAGGAPADPMADPAAAGQPAASLEEALAAAGQMLGGGQDRGAIAKQVWST